MSFPLPRVWTCVSFFLIILVLITLTVGPDMKGRLLPVVDVEYYGDKEQNPPEKADVIRELKIYLEMIEKAYGVKPLIYTRSDLYDLYLKGEFDDYKKWMSSLYTPLSWNYKDDWYLWQYLNRGELEGYTGGEKYIDLNVEKKRFCVRMMEKPCSKVFFYRKGKNR